MKFSFKTWPQQIEWPMLRDIWIEADRGGFWDGVWLNDHFYPPKSPAEVPIFESWSLLAGLACVTDRLRFGNMVTANTFRHPVVVAKMAATIDHMSAGRLDIGIGTGWHEGEHLAYGIPLPPLTDRFDMLDETFAVIDGLMTNPVFSFEGKHHRIQAARFEPKPIQKPRPPFVIGGGGMNRTLPLAAKWADHWNFPDFDRDLDAFAVRVKRLRSLCLEIGRDPAEIEISAQFRYDNLAEIPELIEGYRSAGADQILVSFSPPGDPALPVLVADFLGGL